MKNSSKRSLTVYYLIIFLAFNNGSLISQTRTELEKKKYKNKQELEYTANLLNETEKSKKTSLEQLQLLNAKIQVRQQIIQNIVNEIEIVNRRITDKEEIINEMDNDLTNIKSEYAKLLQYSFIYRKSYNKMMYLLAAENINQLYKRMRFLQELSDYRKKQSRAILETKTSMIKILDELKEIKKEKSNSLRSKENEKGKLKREQNQQISFIGNLKMREQSLKKQILDKIRIAKRLDSEIQKIIAAEAKKRNTKNLFDQLTPDEKIISKSFKENRGKLPWPTETGVIINGYGEHPHPVLKDIKTRNHGIDISTKKDSYIRCIFDGEISKVIAIPGTNYTVIIRHGGFLSVYQNIVDIKVKNGEKVKTKQIIGKAFGNKEDSFSLLHFEIWNEIEKQNPEDWLKSK